MGGHLSSGLFDSFAATHSEVPHGKRHEKVNLQHTHEMALAASHEKNNIRYVCGVESRCREGADHDCRDDPKLWGRSLDLFDEMVVITCPEGQPEQIHEEHGHSDCCNVL